VELPRLQGGGDYTPTFWAAAWKTRARVYICTYHHIEEEKKKRAGDVADTILHKHATLAEIPVPPADVVPNPKHQELLYTEIERLMNAFKGHRCALDFDRGFINSELKEAKDENNEM
jgi:hypothetical protein